MRGLGLLVFEFSDFSGEGSSSSCINVNSPNLWSSRLSAAPFRSFRRRSEQHFALLYRRAVLDRFEHFELRPDLGPKAILPSGRRQRSRPVSLRLISGLRSTLCGLGFSSPSLSFAFLSSSEESASESLLAATSLSAFSAGVSSLSVSSSSVFSSVAGWSSAVLSSLSFTLGES